MPRSPTTKHSRKSWSGLAGFDLPLVYLLKDKLNQPIFGCNNLAGVGGCVWRQCVGLALGACCLIRGAV
jgi:hypothetical protein